MNKQKEEENRSLFLMNQKFQSLSNLYWSIYQLGYFLPDLCCAAITAKYLV